MDFRQLFSDPALRGEFFGRIDEIAADVGTESYGPEGPARRLLEGAISPADTGAAVEIISEEDRCDSSDPGSQPIVRRFLRPVYLVRDSMFSRPANQSPLGRRITARPEAARSKRAQVIPSTGRIDIGNHWLDWVGTGWMVAPQIAVTNRHVSEEFSHETNDGFACKMYLR